MQFLLNYGQSLKISPNLNSYAQLRSFAAENFNLQGEDWVMNYVDSDGDRISLESQEDFGAMKEYQDSSMIKVNIRREVEVTQIICIDGSKVDEPENRGNVDGERLVLKDQEKRESFVGKELNEEMIEVINEREMLDLNIIQNTGFYQPLESEIVQFEELKDKPLNLEKIQEGQKKAKTLLAMTQIFGDEDSEEYVKFYKQNSDLTEEAIIEKWIMVHSEA